MTIIVAPNPLKVVVIAPICRERSQPLQQRASESVSTPVNLAKIRRFVLTTSLQCKGSNAATLVANSALRKGLVSRGRSGAIPSTSA